MTKMNTETQQVDGNEAKQTTGEVLEQKTKVATKEDEAAIEKALRFWNHPSLANVSADEKIGYLKSKGLTNDQIHQAWERMVEQPAASKAIPQKQLVPSPAPPPPIQQQQPSRYYYQTPPHFDHTQYEDEQSVQGNNNAAMLLTVGGMIGLGAAAAVRWLNGGDFCLFPPPTQAGLAVNTAETTPMQQEKVDEECLETQEEEEHVFDPGQDDYIIPDDNEVPEFQSPLSLQVEELTTVLKSHVSTQERLLQKLLGSEQRDVTDRSMSLLRSNKACTQREQPPLALWAQLVELRAQLTCIQARFNEPSTELESKLGQVLAQVSTCLQTVEKEMGMNTAVTGQNDSPASTAETDSCPSSASTTPVSTTPARSAQSPKEADNNNISNTDTKEDYSENMTLPGAILKLVELNEITVLRGGAQILYLYTLNLSSNPNVPRYRKIYTSNESFKKVNKLNGGRDLLYSVGFTDKGNYLEWQEPDDGLLLLQQATASLSILKSPQQQSGDSNALARAALAVLSPEKEEPHQPLSDTPQRTGDQDAIHEFPLAGSHNDDENVIFQTPQPNIIVSPPTTKKQFLVDGFPAAPLDILNESNEEASSSLLDISSASLEIRPLPPEHDISGTQLFSASDSNTRESDEIITTLLAEDEGQHQEKSNSHSSELKSD